jgi:hypothetical protein
VKQKNFMNEFAQFHAAYPPSRREGGQRAEAVFAAALRKAPLATLLAALEHQKQSEQWEIPRYIPLMTNWLLRERWQETVIALTLPGLSPVDQAQRWRSLSPQEQLRRLGYK